MALPSRWSSPSHRIHNAVCTSRAFRLLLVVLAISVAAPWASLAQTNPTPNTFSTLAGGYTGTYAAGGICGGASSGSKYTSVDTLGNGCPLGQAILGPSLSGIGTDGAGNIFVNDYSNGQVRKIDAKSGIVTKIIGTSNTNCSTTASGTGQEQDSLGSGCVNTSAKGPATARGMNVDPWGNVILGSYNSNMINIVCLATSPLCPGTAGRKQVGSFYRIAGCIASQGSGATAESTIVANSGGDNSLASPFQNLAGDVAAWGLTGTAATAATVGNAGTCTSTSGAVNQARNAQADKYGNVYIADTNGERYRVVLGPATYNGVTNPLFAIINMDPQYTANEGYIYTILGSFAGFTSNGTTYNIPTAAGGACSSAGATPAATDALGDGCAFFETGKPSGATTPAGLGVDKDGNPIFSDTQDSVIRVLYVGGVTMANIISKNNGGITPVVGTVYALEGTGTASKGSTPELNVSSGSVSSGNTKVAVDGQGNIYTNDGTGVNIIDAVTGYLRRPITSGGTACTVFGVTSSNGDGCSPGQGTSWTSLSSVGTAIAVDNLGNLLLADSTGRVRKVLAGTLYPTTVGNTFTQNIVLHEPAGTTGITATLLNAASGISIPATAPNCVLYNTSSDNTADCTVVVTFAPTTPDKVGATLSVTNIGGGGATTLYPLVGQATDAALVTDVASPVTSTVVSFGAGALPTSLAMDTGSNGYTIDNHTSTVEMSGSGGSVVSIGTAPSGANQVAVDAVGNVYVTAVGASSVTKYKLVSAGTYTSSTITVPAVASPQGIAIDLQGNWYVSDAATRQVFEIPNNNGFAGLQAPTVIATGLTNPTLLAFDGFGNLLIVDGSIVYRVNASTQALTALASSSGGGVNINGLSPVGVAADAGGNVYIQDGVNKSIFEIPYQAFTPGYVTVLTGETTPSGVGVDNNGNIYAADSGLATPAIIKVKRSGETYTFPTATTVFSGTFTNTGNATSTGYSQTDSSEFPYVGTGSGGCGSLSGTSPLIAGTACTFTVTPNLGNNGQLVTNTTTLLPATSTGSLALTAQEPAGVTFTTTTTVTGSNTAVYAAAPTAELTLNVSEIASDSTSQNGELIKVSIDSGATTNYTLAGGSVSVPISGLTVGSHTFVATYPGDGTYLTSTSATFNFSITQASTSVTWNPSATTQQYSAAVGLGVLNATATAPGSFIYSATPAGGGTTQFIHSASYLPIGTYALGVTFVPTDSVDFAQSTASVSSYTVTQASTSATIGGTQTVVAADGTGNYSSVQSAVNALPNGGSIYIKPGSYVGDITVVQSGIALRGLGGDPTQVILSHAGGSFNNGQTVNQFAGEFTVAQNNGSQLQSGSSVFNGDEASAVIVVAKGVNTALSGSTQTPNNFYAENLSIVNTYNTDTSTMTNTYVTGSACTANTTQPKQSYSALFNAGIECASQALAIWTTADMQVMNNVYLTSLQDTIYTSSQGLGSNGYVPARQYWFRGKVTGDVDYIFGDGASVFDNTSIYSAWHGTATGEVTIHAQAKNTQTGSSGDYLSGFIMNSDVFTSQSTGMTSLWFGRPYSTSNSTSYATWVMLNSYVDQVNPGGYTTGLGPTLGPTTEVEYNDIPYTDPATNSADLNGITYLGTGGNTGEGVLPLTARENVSTNPGTAMANDNPPTAMTQAQAQLYFPTNFLSQTVPSNISATQNWIPTAAIAANVNAFVPTTSPSSIPFGQSITILMHPQTPGLGAVTNGVYTIPTGTYTLLDNGNQIAAGSLDASGEATFTSSTLAGGKHNFTWSYSGDTNFAGSSTSTAYALTVVVPKINATVTLSGTTPITYGQGDTITATVFGSGPVASGTVTFSLNGTAVGSPVTINGSGQASIVVSSSSLPAGTAAFSATYSGDSNYNSASTVSNFNVTVSPYPLSITASCTNRAFYAVNSCTVSVPGLVNGDTTATVFSSAPTISANSTKNSPAGTYTPTTSYTLTTYGAANYAVTVPPTTYQVTASSAAAQRINFPPLPNFASGGSYQLSATSTSGLPVTYTVTSGNATINTGSSILQVTGSGPVTVTANCTDPANDYAAAAPVARSFTAQ